MVMIAADVDAQLDESLRQIAAATGRSRSTLIDEALRSYVESEQAFLAAVDVGKRAREDGDLIDHAVVVAKFRRLTGQIT